MRKWRCIDTAFKNFTIGKVYETDDNGKGIVNDNGRVDHEVPWNFSNTKFIEIFVKNVFTKEDLKEGDIVFTRNDCKLVFFNKRFTNCTNVNSELEKWEIDLIRKTSFNRLPGFDIMQVYRNGELIFERVEKSQKQI